MRKASSELLEQGIQAPSPAPDLIPAKSSTENLHSGWYSKRGHFTHRVLELAQELLRLLDGAPEGRLSDKSSC